MTDQGKNTSSSRSLLELINTSTKYLYDEAPCGYIFTSPDGTFLKVNQTFLHWTGYSESELVGEKKFQHLLSVGSRIYYETNYGPLLRMQGFLNEILLDLETKGQAQRPVLISSSEIRDDAGNVLLIKSTLFDITDRRRYEKELLAATHRAEAATQRAAFLAVVGERLREDDELQQHLSEIAGLAIQNFCDACVVDLVVDQIPKRVASAHRISGKIIPEFSPDEAVYIPEVATLKETPKNLEKLIYDLEPQSILIVPIKRDGKVLGHLSFFLTELGRRFSPEDHDLAVELAFGVCAAMERIELHRENEIIARELKESHEWFSTTLQSIGDAVIAINPDQTVSYLNPVAEDLTGWTHLEAKGVPMARVFNIVNASTGAPAFNPVETVLRENRIVGLANNTALIRRDGTRIIIEDSASPIRGYDSAIKGVVLVFRDVTMKHEEETARFRMLSELKTEKVIREKFVATLTHDLRSPLTSVKLSLQLLLRQAREDQLKITERALKGIMRVDRMIRDLLDANRLNAGEELPLEKNNFELVAMTRDILDELSHIYGDRFVLESPDEVTVKLNQDGIRRVLENLCNNAIKYGSSEEKVSVKIKKDPKQLSLSVNNKGSVIPEEELGLLFEPYKRLESDQNKLQRGWGLGLTLVKGITEAHSGRILVESNEKNGTTFEIILPPPSEIG